MTDYDTASQGGRARVGMEERGTAYFRYFIME
jgi:hypothetical protein